MKKKDFYVSPGMNLVFNMMGGLLPEHLGEDECKILKEEFGADWFDKFGYTEPEYKRPNN